MLEHDFIACLKPRPTYGDCIRPSCITVFGFFYLFFFLLPILYFFFPAFLRDYTHTFPCWASRTSTRTSMQRVNPIWADTAAKGHCRTVTRQPRSGWTTAGGRCVDVDMDVEIDLRPIPASICSRYCASLDDTPNTWSNVRCPRRRCRLLMGLVGPKTVSGPG